MAQQGGGDDAPCPVENTRMSTGEHQYDDVEGPRDGSLGAGQAQGLAQGPNTLGQKAHSMCWFLELSNVLDSHCEVYRGCCRTSAH